MQNSFGDICYSFIGDEERQCDDNFVWKSLGVLCNGWQLEKNKSVYSCVCGCNEEIILEYSLGVRFLY